jgi:hypothetical protein
VRFVLLACSKSCESDIIDTRITHPRGILPDPQAIDIGAIRTKHALRAVCLHAVHLLGAAMENSASWSPAPGHDSSARTRYMHGQVLRHAPPTKHDTVNVHSEVNLFAAQARKPGLCLSRNRYPRRSRRMSLSPYKVAHCVFWRHRPQHDRATVRLSNVIRVAQVVCSAPVRRVKVLELTCSTWFGSDRPLQVRNDSSGQDNCDHRRPEDRLSSTGGRLDDQQISSS